MKYLILVICVVLGLVVLIKLFDIGKNKFEIVQARKLTGLNIEENKVSKLKYTTIFIGFGEKYPNVSFVKFETSEANYIKLVGPLINRLDTSNSVYKYVTSVVDENLFWNFDYLKGLDPPQWWDVPNKYDYQFFYANKFCDFVEDKIGIANNYNGRIVSYYHYPYCYIYIECFPHN